jgi:putative DNA primase/helicase
MNNNTDPFRSAMEADGLVPPDIIEPGKLHRFPTNGRKADSSGWCRQFLDGRAGVYGDFRTGLSTHWFGRETKPPTLAMRQQRAVEIEQIRAETANAQSIQWARAGAMNTTLWAQALPIHASDPVARYLAGRSIHLPLWPSALRFHPGLDYWQDGQCLGRFPAMLGEVTDVVGKRVSLHRTYLTQGGRKADVDVVKKLTAASARLIGCSVKLFCPAIIKGRLTIAVAEGIETALACSAASGTPTVSAISAQGMERYYLPNGVERLIVFADNDISQVGQRAAAGLARRAKCPGTTVRVLTPSDAATDWADVWAAQARGG